MKTQTFTSDAIGLDESYAMNLLGDLLDKPAVKQSGLSGLILESAKKSHWTSFSDDSDYHPDLIGLMALKEHWNGDLVKREAITLCLDQFYKSPRTNWIVQELVKDLAKEIGLSERYERRVN